MLLSHPAVAQTAQPTVDSETKKTNAGLAVASLKVVQGHILVTGNIFDTINGLMDSVSYEVSLECPETLVMGYFDYRFLGVDYQKIKNGERVPISLVLKPNADLVVAANDIRFLTKPQEKIYAPLNTVHSDETGEYRVCGMLGRGFFKQYRMQLDVPAGQMRLYPRTDAPLNGDVVKTFEIKDDRISIPVTYADGRAGRMILGTEKYDTYVSSEVAAALGKPAGDIGAVFLGGEGDAKKLDISQHIALRPGNFAKDTDKANDTATFVAGSSLFQMMRVEIDWEASKIAFTQARTPTFPQEDLDYFKAELTKSPEQMQAYLERYPKKRLSAEAARRLVEWRVAQKGVTDEQLMRGMQWIVDTSKSTWELDNSMKALRVLGTLPDRPAMMIKAGNLALSFAHAESGANVYYLHNLLGEELYKIKDTDEAWSHFLSAAFMPLGEGVSSIPWVHDAAVNMNLGLVYEGQARHARAYARYRKAEDKLKSIGITAENPFKALSPEEYAALEEEDQEEYDARKKGYRILPLIKDAIERMIKQVPAAERDMLDS